MHLTGLDIGVIVAFFAINLGIGLYYARFTTSIGEYFLSDRKAPWWLAGTSMVATTFAVDTPLAVTGFVAQNGIAGNWLWWNMAASGLLTVFFFAALWRRSGVLTDVEFIELRYGGRAASWLRGVRAIYQGVLVNTIIMGWVNLAMVKVLSLTLHVPTTLALYVCLVLTAVYVTFGGLWSVMVTDMLQFVVKMSMAIVLAVVAVAAVGGIAALKGKLAGVDAAHHAAGAGSLLAFVPSGDASWMPLTTFLVFIGVSWWASSYPGAEPGGGSYIAQRIFACKDEKNAVLASLFFNVAHYALRPWPWIVVALCALVLYPHGVAGPDGVIDPELGYVQTLVDHLPASLRGLMLAGFLAAYMSTIGTQLNLGASYLTNDLYRRFIRPAASEQHYVTISRVMTGVVLVLAALVTPLMHSVGDAWKYMLTMTAGVGLVMILRWYWWRVNAWSEIAALAVSAVVGSGLYALNVVAGDDPNATAKRMLITVVVTTVTWIAVTFATRPETEATLVRFYERVRPNDFGWKPVARVAAPATGDSLGLALIDWIAGMGLVFGTLFAIGKFVLAEPLAGSAFALLALVCGAVLARTINRPAVRAAVVTALAVLLAVAPHAARSDEDKVLTNVKGAVSYERDGTAHTLVPSVRQVVADDDVAVTQSNSLAQIALPDSSLVTLGATTRVQLAFFNQTDIANAKFVVYQGKTRFQIQHPQGGKANYTFVTPTTQIAVRGTEGDIAVDQDNLTLNVYSTSDPAAPVQVTYTKGDKSGTTIVVAAGQSLVANLVNGIIQSQVNRITQAALGEFAELGVPTSLNGVENGAIQKARSGLGGVRLPF
jgi:Na+/proline symporter